MELNHKRLPARAAFQAVPDPVRFTFDVGGRWQALPLPQLSRQAEQPAELLSFRPSKAFTTYILSSAHQLRVR